MAERVLWIVGVPLGEDHPLDARAIECFSAADLFIGESRKIAMRLLSKVPAWKEKPLYLLDESSRPEEKDWLPALKRLASNGGTVALFSDTGMPMLFDPGSEVLQACLKLGFTVRSRSSATSWGSACALSGWPAPFQIVGFPPREDRDRARFWPPLVTSTAHCVLMERPYRFLALLAECRGVFGKTRHAFLAWELDSVGEKLLWGTLEELERVAKGFEKTKGEFVLVVQGASPSLQRKNSF